MSDSTDISNPVLSSSVSGPANQLRLEYERQQRLFAAQTPLVQRFLHAQAQKVVEAVDQRMSQVQFNLPDKIVVEDESGERKTLTVPKEAREQMAGGLIGRLTRSGLRTALLQRLTELESSADPAVVASGAMLRYAVVYYMVHNMLPAGRTVHYLAEEGEEIATIPEADALEPESAITAATDAIAQEGPQENGRGELLVPYVPAARRFFLPQWVAFDDQDRLLVNSVNEAQAYIDSMQRYVAILHNAVATAAYMLADPDYQQKRYGMLGQLVNQGRALARYQTREIIATIKHRAAANDLNRGLSLSLPYYDDQDLKMTNYEFEVIPAGRIMFVPSFVVRAASQEQVKVAQDTRLSPSTRRHLLDELKSLETAFQS